jgi:membrane protein YdbS with pleckstrin-like domain
MKEKVLWTGKPAFFSFLLTRTILPSLAWGIFIIPFILFYWSDSFTVKMLLLFWALVFIVTLLYFLISFLGISYTITKDKVIIKPGLLRRQIILKKDRIADVKLSRSPFERKLNTGSILITPCNEELFKLIPFWEYDFFVLRVKWLKYLSFDMISVRKPEKLLKYLQKTI